jgi:hypothetical protein
VTRDGGFTPADIDAVKQAVDLPDLFTAAGRFVRKAGASFVTTCHQHEERSPSLTLYGGRNGQPPHYHCYGCGAHGDGIQAAIELGLARDFPSAMSMLADRYGVRISSAEGRQSSPLPPPPPRVAAVDAGYMPMRDQAAAVDAFLGIVSRLDPQAGATAVKWLDAERGIPAASVRAYGGAWALRGDLVPEVTAACRSHQLAPLLHAAGILKGGGDSGDPERLMWSSDAVLLASWDRDGGSPLYLRPRMLTGRSKYLAQASGDGVRVVPFGAQVVAPAARRGETVYLVEGGITALGAHALGFPTLAVLGRPQAGADAEGTSTTARLTPLMDDLARAAAVMVVPDNDLAKIRPDTSDVDRRKIELSYATGLAGAASLVTWMRAQGLRAEMQSMADVHPALAPFKDFADAAKAARGASPHR